VSLFAVRKSEPRVEERATVQLPAYAVRMLAESTGGVFVDGDSSMRHDAVWSCRTKIAQDVSMLPVDVVRYVGGRRQVVEPVPQIIASPSVSIPSLDWRYQVVDSWLGWGNAWGMVTATTADMRYPLRIELQSPTDVRWEDRGNGLEFFVNEVREDLWPVGRLWHRPAFTLPGSMIGLSPIQYHRVKIGLGISAEKFGADFFTDGGHPSAILAVPGNPTEEQAKGLKQRLMELTRGNREPLVMPAETKYMPIQVNPEDSQFIESQRYTVEQICRIFGEDPTDHGASVGASSVTYANRLDAEAARIKRRQFWITKLQDVLTEMLPRPQTVKINTSAFLMMTPAERHALYGVRLSNKTITINEVRTHEDEAPFGDEFDVPGIPDGSDDARRLSAAEAVSGRSSRPMRQDRSSTRLAAPLPSPAPISHPLPRHLSTKEAQHERTD
jgi:HK97 family phage portal protein